MVIDDEWPIHFTGSEGDVMKWLHDHSIERVRVEYTDFGGVARGKAVALEQFPHTLQHGVAFCATVLAFDMPANVVPGTDYAEARGYGDFILKPDLSSLRLLRHEGGTAQVVGTLVWPDGSLVDSATVSIEIIPVNDAPVIKDAYYNVFEDGILEFTVVSNDLDSPDDLLVFSITVTPEHGSIQAARALGFYTYIPNVNYHGLDTAIISVTDGTLNNIPFKFLFLL